MRGVQAAVALRRQRSRREERKRRLTNSSLESITPRASTGDGYFSEQAAPAKSRGILFGITLFHIGLVLLFIGFLMVITAMIPDYVETAEAYDLVGTGTFFVVLGGVLTLLNRVIAKREEDSLEKYVSGRLARSKSGGRLMRDPDSGLTPDVHRRSHRRSSRSPRSPAGSLDTEAALAGIPEEGAAAGCAGASAGSMGKASSGDSQAALLGPAEPRDVRVVLDTPRAGRDAAAASSV